MLVWAVLPTAGRPAARAQGGNVTAAASLIDPSVDAGQSAEYHIDVINGLPDHAPPAPSVDGLVISYAGRSQSQQFNLGNGFRMQRTTTQTYVYTIETTRPGRFTVPGQQIDVDGTVLRTLPVTLTVLDVGGGGKSSSGQTLGAELIIPRKSAYVGESIPVEVRAYFGMGMRFNADQDPILNGEGFSAQKFTRPRVDDQLVDGSQVHVASYKTAVTGVKTGNLSVGPVEMLPTVQMQRPRPRRQRDNDPFDNPFFDDALAAMNMAAPKQVKLSTNTVSVEIKPLPLGKPADFSGAIGTFKLEAEANPRRAQVGDPITVRMTLTGQGNFDRITAPTFSDEHGMRTYPATSKFQGDDEVNLSGVKTFEQVVIADGARSSLPPCRFIYLDPATGKYNEIITPTIPVEITGGSTPAPGGTSAPVPVAAPPSPPPTPKAAEDILYIRTDAGPARSAFDFLPVYRRRSFWWTQGVVAAFFLGLGALAGPRARLRTEKARRLARVHRQKVELERVLASEGADRGEFYSAATQLARIKAANGMGRPVDKLSIADICEAKNLDPHTAGSVEAIFRRHDELAYSGGQVAREFVPDEERRAVLATLETLDKR